MNLAAQKGQKIDWRKSTVDLMKLLRHRGYPEVMRVRLDYQLSITALFVAVVLAVGLALLFRSKPAPLFHPMLPS